MAYGKNEWVVTELLDVLGKLPGACEALPDEETRRLLSEYDMHAWRSGRQIPDGVETFEPIHPAA
jgi:hypothetical protein